MSPEQFRDLRTVDARSDVYAFGVILYEALAGRLPFDSESFGALAIDVATGDVIPPSKFRPSVPPDLEAIALRAMARRPEDRFATCDALAAALATIAGAPITQSGMQRSADEPPIRFEPEGARTGRRVKTELAPSARVETIRNEDVRYSATSGDPTPTWNARSLAIAGGIALGVLVIALVGLNVWLATRTHEVALPRPTPIAIPMPTAEPSTSEPAQNQHVAAPVEPTSPDSPNPGATNDSEFEARAPAAHTEPATADTPSARTAPRRPPSRRHSGVLRVDDF